MNKFLTVLAFWLISVINMEAQPRWIPEIKWKELMDGVQYAEVDAPEKSVVNDSKLSILKLEPEKLVFEYLTASEKGNEALTADDWAMRFDKNIIINSGMYNYDKTMSNKGFMKNYDHLNNPQKNDYYNAMLAMHPKDPLKLPFEIIDITCHDWDKVKDQYYSFCQAMRMISCTGEGMAFTKRPNQSCSMVVAATDSLGGIYIIFTRSPYTHQKMIEFMKSMPFGLLTTVYLEGGPEASLYINTGDTVIAKFGSYVSNTCDNDDNDHFWKIPNVISIRKKVANP